MKHILLILLSLFITITSNVSLSEERYPVIEVMNGIYLHQGIHQDANRENYGAIANVGFIVGEKCIAVIDSGGSYKEGQLLLKAIQRTSSLPICYVINTHVHPDHILGNAAFKSSNVRFVGHEKLPAAMAARKSYFEEVFKEILGPAYEGAEFIAPSITVKIDEPITLDLGNRKLTLTAYTTGHTDHDLTVLDHQTKTLWTGDLLFVDRIPVMDGSINGWIKIMDKLKSMDLNAVIPGHGNPNKNDWQHDIEKQQHYFVTLREQIRLIIYDLGTIKEASTTVGLEERRKWELFEHYHRRNITASFVELEWE
jgi:quinoprotein relay system zinc metallohydrolase 2